MLLTLLGKLCFPFLFMFFFAANNNYNLKIRKKVNSFLGYKYNFLDI